jgi:hypothetical protein
MRCIVPIYFPLQKLMKQNQFSDSCTKNPEQQGSHICFCINLLHCHVSCSSGKLHFPYGSMKEKRILSWCFYENCLGLAYSLYGPGASPDPALGFTSWLYQVHGVTVSSLSSVSINSSVKWRQTGSVRTLSSTVGGLWVAASSDPPTPWGLLQFRIQETEAQNGRVGIQIWFLCLTAMLVTAVSHKRCSEQINDMTGVWKSPHLVAAKSCMERSWGFWSTRWALRRAAVGLRRGAWQDLVQRTWDDY